MKKLALVIAIVLVSLGVVWLTKPKPPGYCTYHILGCPDGRYSLQSDEGIFSHRIPTTFDTLETARHVRDKMDQWERDGRPRDKDEDCKWSLVEP